MRADMFRVIVERPRFGGEYSRKGRALPFDALPRQQGMGRAHTNNRKHLNENLSPLRRYLGRQVGRPWAKVYSEICQHLRADSTVQQHVRDHIGDFVAVKPRRGVQSGWFLADPWRQRLYVDPKDGILKRTDQLPELKARRRRQFKSRTPDSILLDDRRLERINGLWYELSAKAPYKRSLSRAELRRHGLANAPGGEDA